MVPKERREGQKGSWGQSIKHFVRGHIRGLIVRADKGPVRLLI